MVLFILSIVTIKKMLRGFTRSVFSRVKLEMRVEFHSARPNRKTAEIRARHEGRGFADGSVHDFAHTCRRRGTITNVALSKP